MRICQSSLPEKSGLGILNLNVLLLPSSGFHRCPLFMQVFSLGVVGAVAADVDVWSVEPDGGAGVKIPPYFC